MHCWRSSPAGWARLAILLTAAIALAHAEEPAVPPALQARTWDVATTIPAGAYRATSPVELRKGFDIKVGPGTWLSGIDFQSKNGAQHWDIDGSFFKDVHIGLPLDGRFTARSSVFENCQFYKQPPDFAALWSTRWTFENCVIAREFMRGGVNMTDFSIVARSSTFVGIEFVDLGLKEKMDPAIYLQSKDFVFDRCRFVQCKISPSVLAATKDCVFDQCSFSSMKGPWPTEMTEIKVAAYWDGLGTPSTPAVRKPLVLSFSKLPDHFGPVGTTIDFAASGGTVQAKTLPEPVHFEQIGTRQGTSSTPSKL